MLPDTAPTLSFLVATHREDRPLRRYLDSIAPQLGLQDEVLVIGDTHDRPLPGVEALVSTYNAAAPGQFRYLAHDAGMHDYGHSQLTWGFQHARGQWLHCNDDDDIYAPSAVETMRSMASQANNRPVLFRFKSYHNGLVFWTERGRLQRDHVGGHCLMCPNIPGKIGRFAHAYSGDFDWISETVTLHGGPSQVVWCDAIICIARPTDC